MAEEKQLTKSNTPRILVGLTVLLLVAGATWALMHQRSVAASSQPNAKPKETIFHLEPFVVNLSDRDEKAFLRIGVELGIEKELPKKESTAITDSIPGIRDAVIGVLASSTSDEILSSEGKQQLKANLLIALNQRVPELQVKHIYFTDFLVQR